MSPPTDLPIASDGCTLDDSGLGDQLDRYRQLGATAVTVQDSDTGLLITFDVDVDIDLLDETVATERGCCSFFTLAYDASTRRLSIGIDDPTRADALAALASALRDSTQASVRWSTRCLRRSRTARYRRETHRCSTAHTRPRRRARTGDRAPPADTSPS